MNYNNSRRREPECDHITGEDHLFCWGHMTTSYVPVGVINAYLNKEVELLPFLGRHKKAPAAGEEIKVRTKNKGNGRREWHRCWTRVLFH